MNRSITERLNSLFTRATVKGYQRIKNTASIAVDSGLGDPIEVEAYEPYGFSYRPKDGAEAILFSPGGYADYTISFLVHDRARERPPLEPGDSALHAGKKTFVRASEEKGIDLVSHSVKIESEEMNVKLKKLNYAADKMEFSGKSLGFKNKNNDELINLISTLIDTVMKTVVKLDDGTINPSTQAQLLIIKKKIDAFK